LGKLHFIGFTTYFAKWLLFVYQGDLIRVNNKHHSSHPNPSKWRKHQHHTFDLKRGERYSLSLSRLSTISFSLFLTESHDQVAELILCRGEKLNTMSAPFFADLKQKMKEIDSDDEIRVVILWAEGPLLLT
jgi:hypothetical protein